MYARFSDFGVAMIHVSAPSGRISNDLNSLREIQLAQQKSQRRPHVFRFLQLALLGPVLVGRVQIDFFAVGEK